MKLYLLITLTIICFCLFYKVNCQDQWQVVYGYQGTSCSGSGVFVASKSSSCTTYGCTCSNGHCETGSCQNSIPSVPSGYNGFVTYSDTNCQNPTSVLAFTSSCANYQTYAGSATCNGGNVTVTTYSGGSCSGSSISATYSPNCQNILFLSYKAACGSGACFHENTEIRYKDETLTLKSLKEGKHSSCSVPHIISTHGVKISTDCKKPLRLTREHLVFSQKGLVEASSISVGDLIFQDVEGTAICKVEKVEEEHFETYFGLNCEESIVLADGYKTSTFGTNHQLPSFWMKYASKIVGVKLASSIGDYFVSLLHKYRLL